MDHALAKELKDAGFPQVWPQPDFMEIRDALVVDEIRKKYPEQFDPYTPDLEQLIEACGKDWRGIESITKEHSQVENSWVASSFHGKVLHARGASPLEAVARLWLALKK